jgi:hypothetical protein
MKNVQDQEPETDCFGAKHWRNDAGQLHRLKGHAFEFANGTKEWWVNGKLHRLDGPAVMWLDGAEAWYIHGVQLSKEEFDRHPLVIFHRLCREHK